MTTTLTLLDLAGAIALLLWGVHMVQTGIQRAFGAGLRRVLGVALGNRGKAFVAGLATTAVLQSSTATGLMVSSFAAAGLVDLVPALAAMLGANVGTTLIVQALSFDVSHAASLGLFVGVMMFRRGGETRTRDLGRVLIGLGLMLLALRQLLDLVTPFEDVPSLRLLLGNIATEPLLAVLLAAALTWAAHSSVAIVLLVMTLAEKGVVPPHAAFALVLGANLGTAINPLLEGAASEGGAGRRLPVGNLVNRVAGIALALAMLNWIGRWLVVRRAQPGAGGGGFPYRVQPGLGAAVPATAAAVRRPAAALAAGTGQRRRPVAAALPGRGGAGDSDHRHRRGRARGAADGRCAGRHVARRLGGAGRLGPQAGRRDPASRRRARPAEHCDQDLRHRARCRRSVSGRSPPRLADPGVHDQPRARRRRARPQRHGAGGQAHQAWCRDVRN